MVYHTGLGYENVYVLAQDSYKHADSGFHPISYATDLQISIDQKSLSLAKL